MAQHCRLSHPKRVLRTPEQKAQEWLEANGATKTEAVQKLKAFVATASAPVMSVDYVAGYRAGYQDGLTQTERSAANARVQEYL
jgi:flagellar biosynthesis/type III secretory pathway protein FliH